MKSLALDMNHVEAVMVELAMHDFREWREQKIAEEKKRTTSILNTRRELWLIPELQP